MKYAINEQIKFDMLMERCRTWEAFVQRNIQKPYQPALRRFLATGGASIVERRDPRRFRRLP